MMGVPKMFRNPRKREDRRRWPIHGYVGPNGGGKSAAMVWDTLPSLHAGRPVLGTVRLIDPDGGDCTDLMCEADPDSGHYQRAIPEPEVVEAVLSECATTGQDPVKVLASLGTITGVHRTAHPLWIPLVDWQQVLDARGLDLLLDEVTGVASSRESMGLPAPIANKLVQLRRNDVVVRWSAPSWARADKIIRECSQAVTYCEGRMPKRVEDESGQRAWRNRRLFRWKTYDASAFEDFTVGKRQELETLTRDWHWGPGSPSFATYDTFDAVLTVGTVSDFGTCMHCGGSRRRHACKCSNNHEAREAEAVSRADAGGPRLRGTAGVLEAESDCEGVGVESLAAGFLGRHVVDAGS